MAAELRFQLHLIPLHPAWDLAPWRFMVDGGWIGLKTAVTKRGAQLGVAGN